MARVRYKQVVQNIRCIGVLFFFIIGCQKHKQIQKEFVSDATETYWITVIDSMYLFSPQDVTDARFNKIRKVDDNFVAKKFILELMNGVENLRRSKFDKLEKNFKTLDSLGIENASEFVQFEYNRLKYQYADLTSNVKLGAKAIENNKKIYSKTNDQHHKFLLLIAEGFQKKSEYKLHEALEVFNQAIVEMEALDYPRKNYVSKAYNGIGLVKYQLARLDEAKKAFQKAIDIEIKSNDLAGLARSYSNINLAYEVDNKVDESIEFLKKALEINTQIGRKPMVISNHYNIGMSYMDSGIPSNYFSAFTHFKQGYEMSVEMKYEVGIAMNAFGLGRYFFESNNAETGLPFLLESYKICKTNDIKNIAYHCLNYLYQTEKSKGNINNALKYLEEFSALEKMYYEHVKTKDVEELVIKHNVEKTETENKHLQETITLNQTISKQKDLYLYLSLGVLFLVALFTYTLFRSHKKQKELYVALNAQKEQVEINHNKLQALIQERDLLVKTIIHDLRNPISAIKGCLSLIQDEKDEAELDMIIGMMRTSSSNLDVLISSLLISFSDEKSLSKDRLVTIPIKRFLEENIRAYHFESKIKEIVLQYEIEDFEAQTEPNALLSILGNLITNSIKYSPKNSTVRVSTQKEEYSWKLIFTDEGPGFSEMDKKMMFTMFASLSAKPTGSEIQTGIGLFSVKKTVDMLGGSITLNENYHDGAQFICEFPLFYES